MAAKKEKTPTKVKWVQRFFRVAGNIAPEATINLAVKFFYTPKRRELKPPHVDLMNKADKFRFEVHEFRNPKKKLKLACYSWGQSDKIVLLVHGWDAKALDFYKMIPALVDSGYRVITFDGPGHGNSEGVRSNLVDFKEVMESLIKNKIGVPYAVIGHSMGGGAATYLLMDYDIHVKRLITIAIPLVSKRYFEQLFSEMKIPVKMQRVFYKNMAEEFGEPIERYNLIERKEPIQADDILMIYDEEDEEVSYKDTKDFLERHPRVKSLNIKGVGHYKIIKSKQAIDAIVDFLK
jgi:pimeloyl-ACP methyl ester carboxylesterase